MKIDDAIACIKRLNQSGHEAYLVGGAVRDYLLKRPIHDLDLTTSATTEEIKACFGKTVHVNKDHQTVLVRHNSSLFEITPFKGETIEEDLKNRDFTINALALNGDYNVIDVSGGLEDIKEKRLRSYDVFQAFSQDPLRMLRAARFVSSLGFKPDTDLVEAMGALSDQLSSVAQERITHEFEQLLLGSNTKEAFYLLDSTEMWKGILGLPSVDVEDVIDSLPVEEWKAKERAWLEFAISVDSVAFLASFSLSNQTKKTVKRAYSFFLKRLESEWTSLMFYEAGLELALLVEQSRRSRELPAWTNKDIQSSYNKLPIHAKNELTVTGHDLLKAKKRQAGPWISEALKRMEKAVVSGAVKNEQKALFALLEKGDS